ncbi:splicing factor 3B subunit 2-like protein [Corchorus capsularis]|uniref:Splicing factor 3B subunit 2-like protein n=1 Tax=Corchorus capsularis TaxID=210143 RepID=A0A1R3HIX3_COCAP|nr:splicing factor 3B subunit 2-like protein [Corchorus capsularis]
MAKEEQGKVTLVLKESFCSEGFADEADSAAEKAREKTLSDQFEAKHAKNKASRERKQVKLRKMTRSLSHELKKLFVCQRVLHHHAYYYAEIWSSTIVPHLRIPGLCAPISYGAGLGYHPGGWSKSPVDEKLKWMKTIYNALLYHLVRKDSIYDSELVQIIAAVDASRYCVSRCKSAAVLSASLLKAAVLLVYLRVCRVREPSCVSCPRAVGGRFEDLTAESRCPSRVPSFVSCSRASQSAAVLSASLLRAAILLVYLRVCRVREPRSRRPF